MHCGACRRDVNIARGLARLGCEVQLVPLYTPLQFDGDDPPGLARTFYGGINVWLQQHSALFRHTPHFIDRMFDGAPLLRLAGKFGIKTKPQDLGPMTASVLRGEDGRQRKELERLLAFVAQGHRPDVVHLTNALLSGIAPALKRRLGVPVACTLEGEDDFVEAMPEPHRSEAWDIIRRNVGYIDLFISPSDGYVPKIATFLGISPERIHVVPTGIDVAAFPAAPPPPERPFTIGYLSRITPGKGLDLLIEATRILTIEQGKDIRLRVAGQTLDKQFWRSIREAVRRARLGARFERLDVRDHAAKVAFLHGCNVFCVPSRYPEIRGTAVLEAIAAGVPVVVPDHGVFPEILRRTGGGLLFPTGDIAELAAALGKLANDPKMAAALGRAGREGIDLHHGIRKMAEETLKLYSGLCKKEIR